MSVYNGEKYLKQAVESILQQTFNDFEFIIINDGSTDKSLEILKEFERKDGRIKIISRGNRGLVYSLNEGIKNARGEYVARMDADDISRLERLEKQLRYMQENTLAICGTWAEGVDSHGMKIKDMDYPPRANNIKGFTLLHNPFIHPSVMFRKDVFEKVRGYRKIFNLAEDHELWTRMIFTYNADNIPERLLKYRLHDGQITRRKNFAMRMKGTIVRILALFRLIFS